MPCEEKGSGRKKGERRTRCSSQEADKRVGVTKMAELYEEEQMGEGQPRPWVAELNVEGWFWKPFPLTGRD